MTATTRASKKTFAISLAIWLLPFMLFAAVPDATINGPIATEPHPSLNSIYGASAIELWDRGYVEEEYFIEGTANRYSATEMKNAEIVDRGHPYRSRLIVRRPVSAQDFNGVVVVEWINVTGGNDNDIDWWQVGDHLVRNGYAYVGVSAQQDGLGRLRDWSPDRYGSLDLTDNGTVTRDALSYDVFSAVGKAINRSGESTRSGEVDIMGGLKAEMILATGHSQSAGRLASYLNNIHPLEPVYDGVMVHGGGGRIRDDQSTRIFKIMAETDMPRRAATPQPDTETFRQWEVAGTSHVDILFELEWSKVRLQRDGLALSAAAARDPGCQLPAHSRVPFRDVMNAAFEHLVARLRDDVAPPTADPLQVARMLPELAFARDEYGNVLGGIRLAEHVVATARNTGMNTGDSRFCFLYGSHQPFGQATLTALYPNHDDYVEAVKAVVDQNLADGYILPYAAELTIRRAESANIGR
ncbi:MAG: hypothetical protein MK319_08570 [Pseudomonadales bacterium]|nr:hypothetical protein [Pseudomonadales bacterium]